jgi:glutamate synthase domain-containing protein 3
MMKTAEATLTDERVQMAKELIHLCDLLDEHLAEANEEERTEILKRWKKMMAKQVKIYKNNTQKKEQNG